MNIVNSSSTILNKGSTETAPSTHVQDTKIEVSDGQTGDQATTKFIDDGTVARRDETFNTTIDNTLMQLNDTQMAPQTIIDFLSKPIKIAQGTFNTTDTFSFLNSVNIPYGAFNATEGSIWVQKLAGFFGIRMDMRFRLVANANPMQQGRYMIGWVPFAAPGQFASSSLKNAIVQNMHLATLVQRTTVPHVELDLSQGTTAELLVPFISTQSFYPINAISTSDRSVIGTINLYPYSPLVAPTGPTVVGYTLYCSFENVKLFGAASPQAGLDHREVSNKNNGPVSGITSKISKVFKEFKDIPLLGSYAKDVSWIADRVTSVASIFGYSKPIAGDNITKLQVLTAPGHTNVDGDSDSRSLSFLQKPGTVNIDGISGTDYDEMDFSFIARKFSWFNTTTWTEAAAIGNLLQFDVNPTYGIAILGGATHLQPVAFVASFFGYWRGSLKYRFKIVKTGFHSGRLQFCFYPTDERALTGSPQYVNRQIVDIRQTNEVELTIPYISRFPWTPVGNRIGILSVDIVDVLVAPANVSTSVNILCEIAGGEDMEFAVPSLFSANPIAFVPQSGIDNDLKLVESTIGNSSITTSPNVFNSTTIGDKISSFRAYLKRFHPITPSDKASASTVVLNGGQVDFFIDAMPVLGPTAVQPTYYWNADMLTLVGSCYAMWKGGIRVRNIISYGQLSGPNTSSFNTPAKVSLGFIPPNATTAGNNIFNNFSGYAGGPTPNSNAVIQATATNNSLTVEIPQYTGAYCRNKIDCMNIQTTSPAIYGNYYGPGSSTSQNLISTALPGGTSNVVVSQPGFSVHNYHRAIADDGSFLCFISVPPLVTQNFGTQARSYY